MRCFYIVKISFLIPTINRGGGVFAFLSLKESIGCTSYTMLRTFCIRILTMIIDTQQEKPKNRGLPPFLISFTISVFKPMALIAMTIKNLLRSFRNPNPDSTTSNAVPVSRLVRIVVMTEAKTKIQDEGRE